MMNACVLNNVIRSTTDTHLQTTFNTYIVAARVTVCGVNIFYTNKTFDGKYLTILCTCVLRWSCPNTDT